MLRVSENGRYLTKEGGGAFLWLGDTAWELFHKLDREEARHYLEARKRQGFNVIQAVLLAEFEGLTKPNAYGRYPLRQNQESRYDPTLPDLEPGENGYHYWDHVDFILDLAAELGLVVALLPTWGDKYHLAHGVGPEIFTRENACVYGKWLGERYRESEHILWVLGGDRHLGCGRHFDVNRGLARGIREAGCRQLITFHPRGNASSSEYVHEEDWLDFNMIQSGHGEFVNSSYEMIRRDYGLSPVKPVVEGEPKYEDHPACFQEVNGYFDAFDTRKAAYWAVFFGALGVTYGHHCCWKMIEPEEVSPYYIMDWRTALTRPGAENYSVMGGFLREQGFPDRVPSQESLAQNYEGELHCAASRRGESLCVYSPYGLPIHLKEAVNGGLVRWFNPRTGEWMDCNQRGSIFHCPTSGRNEDWVLAIE